MSDKNPPEAREQGTTASLGVCNDCESFRASDARFGWYWCAKHEQPVSHLRPEGCDLFTRRDKAVIDKTCSECAHYGCKGSIKGSINAGWCDVFMEPRAGSARSSPPCERFTHRRTKAMMESDSLEPGMTFSEDPGKPGQCRLDALTSGDTFILEDSIVGDKYMVLDPSNDEAGSPYMICVRLVGGVRRQLFNERLVTPIACDVRWRRL